MAEYTIALIQVLRKISSELEEIRKLKEAELRVEYGYVTNLYPYDESEVNNNG